MRGSDSNLALISMDYRGIRYTIRVGTARNQWMVAIYPNGIETGRKQVVVGDRRDAELAAHSLIDRWLKRHRLPDLNKPPTRSFGA